MREVKSEEFPSCIMRHTFLTRWFHWSQALLLAVLTVSGLAISWSWRLQSGIAYHFLAAWLFGLNLFCYFAYLSLTGRWRRLTPHRDSLPKACGEFSRDLKGQSPLAGGDDGYNHGQRLAYSAVLALELLAILSGLAIWKPIELQWITAAFGGYTLARQLHYAIWLGFQFFLLVHVGQAARAGWSTIRAMIIGGG